MQYRIGPQWGTNHANIDQIKCSFILRTLTRDDVTKLPKMSRQETSSQSFQEKVTKIILEREEVFTSVLVGKHFWLA